MSIYRLPPGTFTGGRQPYDNKDLNPAIEAIDSPVPRRNPAILLTILIAWQPISELPQRSKFVPQVSEERIPYTRQSINQNWDVYTYQPIINRKLPVDIIAVPEDTVLKRYNINPIIQNWQIEVPTRNYKTYVPITTEKVDNPPFGQKLWLPGIIYASQPFVPLPQVSWKLPIVVTDVPVNNPPFGQRYWLNNILNKWESPPPLPWAPHFNPPPTSNIIMWIWRRIN